MQLGILSDTHSLLRPALLLLLEGSDHILHIGDVGDPEILGKLARIAPVTAIRGNIDRQGPCSKLPETEVVTLGTHNFYLLHSLQDLDLDPKAAGFSAVLYGHSHKPEILWKKEVLYLNPGSCGPKRFNLPTTCARITIQPDNTLHAEILHLPL